MTAPVFIALTQKGSNLASKLAKSLSGATVHGLKRRTKEADERLDKLRMVRGEIVRAALAKRLD